METTVLKSKSPVNMKDNIITVFVGLFNLSLLTVDISHIFNIISAVCSFMFLLLRNVRYSLAAIYSVIEFAKSDRETRRKTIKEWLKEGNEELEKSKKANE